MSGDRRLHPARPGLRVLRGVALAGLSALITAIGHLVGGGSVPDLALLVVLLPLLAWVLVAVADRCTSATAALATLAVGQLTLHYLLVLLHPDHDVGPAAFGTSAMVAMHALATLATAVMVRGADRAVLAVLAALNRVVPRRLTVPTVATPLPMMVLPGPAVALQLCRARMAPVVRRGPPVGC